MSTSSSRVSEVGDNYYRVTGLTNSAITEVQPGVSEPQEVPGTVSSAPGMTPVIMLLTFLAALAYYAGKRE